MNLPIYLAGNVTVCIASYFAGCFLLLSFPGQPQYSSYQKAETLFPSQQAADTFVMCDVMPGADVAAHSPYTIPYVKSEPWPTEDTKTGCAYKFKSAEDNASIAIGVVEVATYDEAKSAYNMYVDDCRRLWDAEPERIKNTGDSAFFCGKDDCGIRVLVGRHILDVNFRGQADKVTAEQKKQTGIALARMVIERLPNLKKRK